MADPITPRAIKPPAVPPAMAPTWDDLCDTSFEDDEGGVDEDEGVGDVLVVDALVGIVSLT